MEKIFFQSSLPRSGSTLLQNILAQNPDLYATPTSPLCDYLSMIRDVYSNNPNVIAQDEEQMKLAYKDMCKMAIVGFFHPLTQAKYAIDKSRGWIPNFDFLHFVLDSKPKVICMIRDLRDIFASNEKNYRKNPHRSRQILMGDANTLPKRIDVWASGNNFTGSAIEGLNDAIRTGVFNDLLVIKYENLCLYPDEAMKKIYEYLEIPYFKHNFDFVHQSTKENDQIHGIFGQHTIRNKVEMQVSDAESVLGKDVSDWIYNNYKWFYDFFNYKY